MTRQVVPLGRVLGIPIGLDYSWFLIFGLLTWSLATSYYPGEFGGWSPQAYWATGAVTALLLFASVLLHELGHALVALRYKIPVRSITLFIFGGVAQIGAEPPSARAELAIAIAGPFVSLMLAGLFGVLMPFVVGLEPVWGVVKYLAVINLALVLFNLIPGYPLDGGRVLRAILWGVTRSLRRATLVAANAGRFFGILFILYGVWQVLRGNLGGGLWIAFIGWFLDNAASTQVQQVVFRGLLSGHRVAQAMSTTCASVGPDITLQQLVDEQILGHGRRCLLVSRGADVAGLMTLHRIKGVPRSAWATTMAGEVMLPIDQLKSTTPSTELWSALEQLDRDGVNQLPVVEGGRVVGMLSREDAITFLRTVQDLGA